MNKKRVILLLCIVAIFIVASFAVFNSCRGEKQTESKEEQPVAIDTIPMMLTQIHRCSRLNTAEIIIHKIITHDDELKISGKFLGKEISLDIPAGKRKVAIPMYATVKASIDLTKITSEDIVKNGEKIEIFLPQPVTTITETHIDHDGVKQYVAFTRQRFSDEELQKYEKQGRDAIEKDIPKLGIEEMARESAARQIIPIIEMMGYEESNITISFRKDGKNNTILRENK